MDRRASGPRSGSNSTRPQLRLLFRLFPGFAVLLSGAASSLSCGGGSIVELGADIDVEVAALNPMDGSGVVTNFTQVPGQGFSINCSLPTPAGQDAGCSSGFYDANGFGSIVFTLTPDPGSVVTNTQGCSTFSGSSCRVDFNRQDVSVRIAFDTQVATSVEISPQSADLTAVGETVTLTASVSDQTGGTMDPAGTTWQSLSPDVASVSGSGGSTVVTAVAEGTAQIVATATVGAADTATVTVDLPLPDVEITSGAPPSGNVGTAYSHTLTATGGDGTFSWSITQGALPAGLALDGPSGVVGGTPTAPGTANFTVEAASGDKTASSTLSIQVYPDLVVTTTALPDGTAGVAYTQSLTASGGDGSYAWSVTGGFLPSGLSLDPASGTISGTPSATGTDSFKVEARSAGDTATAQLSITIQEAPIPLSVVTESLPDGAVGATYSASLSAAGGAGQYAWEVTDGALPSGLALDGASGRITGTPLATGTSPLTVEVTSGDETASAVLSLSVLNGANVVIFSDMEVDTLWTQVVRNTDGGATSTTAHPPTGGVEGAFREIQHVFPGAGQVNYFHGFSGRPYNPSVEGEITSVTISEYRIKLQPVGTGAVGTAIALEQGGTIYYAGQQLLTEDAWTFFEVQDLTAADFLPAPGPDFSATGGVITFGFIRSNTRNTQSATTVIHGTDSYRVEIRR